MKYFLKACSIVNVEGIHGILEGEVNTSSYKSDDKKSIDIYDILVGSLADSRPICFFKKPKLEIKNVVGTKEYSIETYYKSTNLDAPFKAFSIENFDGSPIHEHIGNIDKTKCLTFCVIVVEVKPKEYLFYNLNHFVENNYWVVEAVYSPITGRIVEQYLHRLNTERVGFENTRQVIKIGSGKHKRNHRIRKIVYVCPKKEYEKQNEKLGKQIDWSHRWLVRGHWRKCEGALGKDREGLHCVPNYTWVVDHVKGPEDKILIADKTRIVKKIGEQIHV